MSRDTKSAERATEIVSLLRSERPRRFPASLVGAAAEGDLERMQLFLDRGADIEQRSQWQSTPLSAACTHGQAEAVRWLIAHGAQLDLPDDTNSPIESALSKANCEVAALLLDAGLPIERAAWGAIAASGGGRLDMLHWLVGRGLDLDRSYPRLGVLRERALRSAMKYGKDEVVRFLKGELDPGPPPADGKQIAFLAKCGLLPCQTKHEGRKLPSVDPMEKQYSMNLPMNRVAATVKWRQIWLSANSRRVTAAATIQGPNP